MAVSGAFAGYAGLFDIVDRGRDRIARGAFAKSLRQRGVKGVKLLWQHDPAEPIGVLDEVREDAKGLFVRGRLLLDIARARHAYALMKAAALDGLSIGYRTILSDTEPQSGVRVLREIDLWEVSLVTFPMQEGARVHQFKTAAGPPDDDWRGVLHSLARAQAALASLPSYCNRR